MVTAHIYVEFQPSTQDCPCTGSRSLQLIHSTPTSALTSWAEFQDLQWHLGKEIQILFQLSSEQLLLNCSCRSDQEPLLSTWAPLNIAGLRLCQVLYLEQLQFVLCVASTKSQDATLSAVSSSHKPFDVAEYFLLGFNTRRVIWEQHMFFSYLSGKAQEQFGDEGFSKERINSLFLTY